MSDSQLPTFATPHDSDGRDIFVDLGPLTDFPPLQARLIETPHGRLLVYPESTTTFHLYHAICPHMGNHFTEKDPVGHSLVCPLHSWEFDLRTGANINEGFRTRLTRIPFTLTNDHLIAHLPLNLE